MNVVDYAIDFIIHNTRYTPYQCYRVIEIIQKWGEKAPFHCNKKQKDILNMLVYLLSISPEE